jgi:hypothetical protein
MRVYVKQTVRTLSVPLNFDEIRFRIRGELVDIQMLYNV